MLEINKIHNYNCLDGLKLLDDNSVDCCVTSPPYVDMDIRGIKLHVLPDKHRRVRR